MIHPTQTLTIKTPDGKVFEMDCHNMVIRGDTEEIQFWDENGFMQTIMGSIHNIDLSGTLRLKEMEKEKCQPKERRKQQLERLRQSLKQSQESRKKNMTKQLKQLQNCLEAMQTQRQSSEDLKQRLKSSQKTTASSSTRKHSKTFRYNICPYGHEFGKDTYDYDECCEQCDYEMWDACGDAYDAYTEKYYAEN